MITRRKRTREESHINEATSVSELPTRKDGTQAKERSPRKKMKREALAEPGEIVLQPKYCLQRHYVDLGKCLACIVGTTLLSLIHMTHISPSSAKSLEVPVDLLGYAHSK